MSARKSAASIPGACKNCWRKFVLVMFCRDVQFVAPGGSEACVIGVLQEQCLGMFGASWIFQLRQVFQLETRLLGAFLFI
jgi:hypothetical protein